MITIILLILALNFFIILNYEKFVKFINIYDLPNTKIKRHKKKVPITGGIILFINIFVYLFYQLFFFEEFFIYSIDQFHLREIISIIFFLFSIFILGLYDDKFRLMPNTKLIWSIIIILCALTLNDYLIIDRLYFSFLNKVIFLNNFSTFFTIFCFLAILNALNFFDGINGQSCIFFSFLFWYLFLKTNVSFFYIFIFLLLFLLLILNIKIKLFLGDGGILLLGSFFSIFLILNYNLNQNKIFADEIFLVLFLPGIDLIRLIVIRFLKGKNVFEGDLLHIHHLLITKFSLIKTNVLLSMMSILPLISYIYVVKNFFIVLGSSIILYVIMILYFKK